MGAHLPPRHPRRSRNRLLSKHHSRLAYVEALDDETADTFCGFFERSRVWFRSIGIAVDEIITDKGENFRCKKFAVHLARRRPAHIVTRPYRPQTNGKAEKFNRTLTDEFLYAYKFRSEPDHRRRLNTWTHHHNAPPSQAHPPHAHTTSMDTTPTPVAQSENSAAYYAITESANTMYATNQCSTIYPSSLRPSSAEVR